MRRVIVCLSLVLWLPGSARGTPGVQLVPGVGSLVARPEGHPSLLLDYGRALDGYLNRFGLSPVNKALRRGADRLTPIEKTRLDARRIWAAPRLSPEEKLERLVAVVKHRFPDSDKVLAAHERLTRAEMRGPDGFARLSRRAARRTGLAFERVWLLHGLLAEVGMDATVNTGRLIDVMERPRGAHAWIEVTLDGRKRLVDPSSSQPLPETRPTTVNAPGGHTQQGIETLAGWLYLPENAVNASGPRPQ